MLNKTITLEQVLSLNPCYSKEKILEVSEDKTELTIGEIIDLRFVPAEDKLWLLLREEIIPARTLHEFALWCAETALTKANVTDERSWNALKVKRLWLDGKATDKELDAARYAAWDVVRAVTWYDAAWDDAREAARHAASDAARHAAWDDAREAASDAAWAAARYAAWEAASDAASDAARDVASDAARAAAWYAARDAAWEAASDAQLAKLKEMLRDNIKEKETNE
jgi:hypothetical protein